jgi:hypothetical protein
VFDFEKLDVYQWLRATNVRLLTYLDSRTINGRFLEDQLKRAAFPMSLNLAVGVGRTSKLDKKGFYHHVQIKSL